jgi:hypothetical protein
MSFNGATISVLDPESDFTAIGSIAEVYEVEGEAFFDDRIGGGSAVVPLTAVNQGLLTKNRVVFAITTSTVHGNPMQITAFKIKGIIPSINSQGNATLTVSGPNLLDELTTRLIGENLIALVLNKVLASNATAELVETTLASAAIGGANEVVVSSATNFLIGQPITIELDAGGNHTSLITNIVGTTISFAFSLPSAAAEDNEVSTETGYHIEVTNAANLEAGQPIYIEMDTGENFATIITNVTGTTIRLAAGLPINPDEAIVATAGNAVVSHRVATQDIAQIMVFAPATWNAPTNNTIDGSYIVGNGQSVWEALEQARIQGGGHYRLRVGVAPIREVEFLDAPDTSGVTQLVLPASATDAAFTDSTKGIIHDLQQDFTEQKRQITRVTLFGAGGLKITAAQGYVDEIPGIDVDWAGSQIIFTINETGGAERAEQRQVFDSIQPAGDTEADVIQAAITLYKAGLKWLNERQAVPVFYDVTCVVHQAIKPFSEVQVIYSNSGLDINTTLVVHHVRHRMEADGNLITYLKLGNTASWYQLDDDDYINKRFQQLDQAIHSVGSTIGLGGTTGSAIATSLHHHSLQGLLDDDHLMYLRADGGRALTGNLPVSAGRTIDGVDISAHASNPSAHHNPVTIGAGGLSTHLALAGQSLTFTNLLHSEMQSIGPDDHHGRQHNIVSSSDHTAIGAALSLVGLTGTNILGIVIPSDDPGPLSKILKSSAAGGLVLQNLQVQGSVDITNGGNLTVGTNVFFVNNTGQRVGINMAPDAQFALDIEGNIRWSGWGVGKMAIQISGALMICHYDGKAPFETDYTGTALGHMGQSPGWGGGVIFRPGKFGTKAVQLAEATTNLCTNPSFETWTSGWFSLWGDTLSQSSEQAWYGSSSLKIVSDEVVAGSGAYHSVAVTPGSHSVSCWVYVPSDYGGTAPQLRAYDGGGFTTLLASVSSTLTDEWELLKLENVLPETTGLYTLIFCPSNPASGKFFYADAVQVEAKAYCTPYCDGSLDIAHPTGTTGKHSWSGTAHASTSSRVASNLAYTSAGIIKPNKGTVMAWVKLPSAKADYRTILRTTSTGHIILRISDTGFFQAYAGSTQRNDPTAPFPINEWVHVALTYDGVNMWMYKNGVEVTWGSVGTPFSGSATIFVGRDSGASFWLNGLIDDLITVDRVVPADEIRSIYESDAPVFAETSSFNFTTPNQLVWADENGLFMRRSDGQAAFAVIGVDGHSWGGQTLDMGDLLLGNTSGANFFYDISDGRINIRGGTTVEAFIDTDGSIKAGGGNVLLDSDGIHIVAATSVTYDASRSLRLGPVTRPYNSRLWAFLSGTTEHLALEQELDSLTDFASIRLLSSDIINITASFIDHYGRLRVQNEGALIQTGLVVGTLSATPVAGRLHITSAGGATPREITIDESTGVPANPTSNAQMRVYMSGDKFVIQFNQGGTVRYKYLDLTGTGVTWVHTTTPP